MRHRGEEYILEFDFKFFLLLLLHLSDVHEQEDVHFLVHEVDVSDHAVYIFTINAELGLVHDASARGTRSGRVRGLWTP